MGLVAAKALQRRHVIGMRGRRQISLSATLPQALPTNFGLRISPTCQRYLAFFSSRLCSMYSAAESSVGPWPHTYGQNSFWPHSTWQSTSGTQKPLFITQIKAANTRQSHSESAANKPALSLRWDPLEIVTITQCARA